MRPGIFGERRWHILVFGKKFFYLLVNPFICIGDGKARRIFPQKAQPFGLGTEPVKFGAEPLSRKILFLNDYSGVFAHQRHGVVILMVFRHIGRRNQDRRFA